MPRQKIELPVSKETLHQWYHVDNLTLKAIAKRLSTSVRVVRRTMDQLGVPVKHGSEYRKRHFPEITRSYLERLYWEQGMTIDAVAAKYKVSPIVVQRWFREYGITKRTSGESRSRAFWSRIPLHVLEDLYNRYRNIDRVASELGLPRSSVAYVLRKKGLHRTRYEYFANKVAENDSVNVDFFKTMSADFAYVLGLLLTDGCLSANGVSIELIDEDVIQWMARVIGYKHDISIRQRNGRFHYKIQFRNQEAIRELEKYGLTRQKSRIVRCPQIPEEYIVDFLRGVFEGDGSVGARKKPYIVFVSASEHFIQGIKKYTEHVIGGDVKYTIRSRGRKTPLYVYRRNAISDIIAFGESLYKGYPYGMERKKRVFEERYGCRLR